VALLPGHRTVTQPLSQQMRQSVGMLIPVWFREETGEDGCYELLGRALGDVEVFVQPQNLLLIVDGCPVAEEPTRRLQSELAERLGQPCRLRVLDENLGKGGVLVEGFRELLGNESLRWLSVRDDDGDHSIWDLPHLFRLGEQMRAAATLRSSDTSLRSTSEPTDLIVICGRRASLDRPLGTWRAEYERLVAELVWEALKAALAAQGKALNTQYLNAYSRYPDLQSGYKLYSRAAAQLAADALEREAASHPAYRLLGWGVEVVAAVEVLLAGGLWGEMMRVAYETQPQTTFDEAARWEEYGREAAWALRRLGLPPAAALQLLDNALPQCRLYQGRAGREELLKMRAFVARELGLTEPTSEVSSPEFF